MTRQNKIKILFFGDSLTEYGDHPGGYMRRLKTAVSENDSLNKYLLVSAGISGNTVDDLYRRMEEDVIAEAPLVVVVYVGINDVWHLLSGSGIKIDKFERYYEAIIKRLQENNIKVVICTPSVIGEKKNNANQLDAELEAFSEVVRKLAAAYNCSLIDLRKAFVNYEELHNVQDKDNGILTIDGVHLNDQGNQLVADEMMKTIFKQ